MIGFDDMPLLETLTEKGEVPKERIKNAEALRSIFVKMQDDDLVNAANRSEHQELLDGGPPYLEKELREANMMGMTNLNFGGAEQSLERAMAPYYRLVQGSETLVDVKTLYGPEDERHEINAILSEEISLTVRQSETFSIETLMTVQKFVKDGVGVAFFPDEDDWRYRGAGLGQFYFDRQRMACESDQEIVCAREEYSVTRLFAAIKDLELGEETNWNPKVVREAIVKGANEGLRFDDWERLQDELKNNDIYATQICPPVQVVHGWIKEFDGTWSHYMITEEALGSKEFLYKHRGKYQSLSEAMVLFPYGLGTNAKVHGIRGLLYKIFPMEQQRNRSISRLIDQGMLASSMVLQAQDEESLNTTGLQYFGNTAVIGPEWKAVQIPMPDLQRSVIPSIELMEQIRNDRSSGYTSESVFDGDQRKTKFEISAHLEQSAQLSDSAMDFFYAPFERLLRESVRRISRRDYVAQDPGGKEARELRLRLVKRGVPLEALYRIDHKATRVVRSIGAGSPSAKTLAISRMEEMYPRMDDVGQANFNRIKTVDVVGVANADLFFPRSGVRRTTAETSIAILQNNDLLEGKQLPVLPSDNHLAQAREHLKPLIEIYQAVEENQVPIAEAAVQIQFLYGHAAEHVDLVSGDPAVQEEAAAMRDIMQKIGEIVVNGLKEADKLAEEAAAAGEGGEEGPTPEQIREAEKHRQSMQQAQEKHEMEMAQRAEKAELENAIKDATAASSVARTRIAQLAQQEKAL